MRRHRRADLAVTLPRDRVAHARLGASLVAVAPPAVGVVEVAGGTEVTLSPDDIGLALALPAVHVAARLRQLLHAGPRAIAVLAADEGVAAEGLGLADNALRLQGVRRADALPRHFVTETRPAVAGWKGHKRGCVWGSKTQAAQGEHEATDLCRQLGGDPPQGWKMQPLPKSAPAL